MKTTIRNSTFETNSSSVHAFVYLSPEAYDYLEKYDAYLLIDAASDEADSYGSAMEPINGSAFVVSKEVKEIIGTNGTAFRKSEMEAFNKKTDDEISFFKVKDSPTERYGYLLEIGYMD